MCNRIFESEPIKKSGYGWKLFKDYEGDLGSLCGCRADYTNMSKKGVVIGEWEDGSAFCFFLDEGLANLWAKYWKSEGFPKPKVKRIQYWGGKGRRQESCFISRRGAVEIAFCKSFRVVKEVAK
jgi:hypothetical protein